MLGGIGQLYSLTHNETLLDVADSIFEALRRTLTPCFGRVCLAEGTDPLLNHSHVVLL